MGTQARMECESSGWESGQEHKKQPGAQPSTGPSGASSCMGPCRRARYVRGSGGIAELLATWSVGGGDHESSAKTILRERGLTHLGLLLGGGDPREPRDKQEVTRTQRKNGLCGGVDAGRKTILM